MTTIIRVSLLAASTLPLLLGQGADWPNVGGDPGSTRYSTLKQITPANVANLKRAWTYDTGDAAGGFRGTEATPIVVGGMHVFFHARPQGGGSQCRPPASKSGSTISRMCAQPAEAPSTASRTGPAMGGPRPASWWPPPTAC